MTSSGQTAGLLHTALCYRTTPEALEQLVPFVQDGLRAGDDVFASVSSTRAFSLKSALGEDADHVRWRDAGHWHPHPARRLRALQELADGVASHDRGRLRFIGECAFPGGSPDWVAEWERFDAVLNRALASAPISMVCTYDVSVLAPDVVERTRCSHPHSDLMPPVENEAYLAPADCLVQRRGAPIPAPPGAARLSGRPTPLAVRALVQRVLGDAGVNRQEIDDMTVAATEILTNAWQVGAEHIDVACWCIDGEVGVQVDDDGPGLRDPFAGYRRPGRSDERGRGLWIVRQLADTVDVWPLDRGTSVRMRLFDGAP